MCVLSISVRAAAFGAFYKAVRHFSLTRQLWETAVWHQVTPDERFNLPLVSFRVYYGTHDEFFAVMAAAGLNSTGQELKQQLLALPTPQQLTLLKRQTGFESLFDLREDFKPVWVD